MESAAKALASIVRDRILLTDDVYIETPKLGRGQDARQKYSNSLHNRTAHNVYSWGGEECTGGVLAD